MECRTSCSLQLQHIHPGRTTIFHSVLRLEYRCNEGESYTYQSGTQNYQCTTERESDDPQQQLARLTAEIDLNNFWRVDHAGETITQQMRRNQSRWVEWPTLTPALRLYCRAFTVPTAAAPAPKKSGANFFSNECDMAHDGLVYGVALSVFRVWCIENQSVQRSGTSERDRSDIGVTSE